jgi:uncharacterized membrane protein YgcG
MRARRWGRIVNLSSAAARGAGLPGVHYNASKAGIEGLTRGYAARLAREGITVNAVAPGPIDTEMAGPLKASNVAEKLPVGRLGEASEVAQAVLMVIGNAFITGQTITDYTRAARLLVASAAAGVSGRACEWPLMRRVHTASSPDNPLSGEVFMRNLDFSSWQALLSTFLGLAVITLIGVGIRLLLMQTVQQRRERENRQINERLRTLIAAYKTLGGSGRSRRIRDAVEAALADVILLGTEEQVRLAAEAALEMTQGRPIHTAKLVVSLRNFIREVLDLDPVPHGLPIPAQGPARPSGTKARDGGSSTGSKGGGIGSSGGGGGGMGSAEPGNGSAHQADEGHAHQA